MRDKSISVRCLLLVGATVLALGCSKADDPRSEAVASSHGDSSAASSGVAVAKVGDTVITLADFEAQLNQQNSLIRARYKSAEQKKKLLEKLVEREAMVIEAKRLGLDKDPEMVRGYKKILARHLVNVEFNKRRAKQIEISEEDIKRYYEENHDRYHSAEKVRVHHIFLAAPRTDQAKRKAARAKAKKLLGQLKNKPHDRRLFLELARENSADEATRQRGGDVNFRTKAELEEQYGRQLAEAAFALEKANDLSDVIETDSGVHILRQSGRQAAIDLPLSKVEGQIRTTLFARARGDAYRDFVADVKNKIGVQIFDDEMAKAKVDTSPASSLDRSGRLTPPHERKPPIGPARPMPRPLPSTLKRKPADQAQKKTQ